ncbi:MAG: hypothetical protein UW09_C0001G0005 [candidate division TM6 bacterium GW2011_GWF2_43_87]|nr:MAG: hypothetical protein UW09_C0001G0005 [candidate division TM6 bacterium GW2011_GWF2_43_87]
MAFMGSADKAIIPIAIATICVNEYLDMSSTFYLEWDWLLKRIELFLVLPRSLRFCAGFAVDKSPQNIYAFCNKYFIFKVIIGSL